MAVGSLTTGKIVEAIFENAIETHEKQISMLDLVSYEEPNMGTLQNAGDYIWRPVQQHRPIQTGWDMTGNEQGIIEEMYPANLGASGPDNDIINLRIDNMRDMSFFEKAGKEAGLKLASNLNLAIASNIGTYGSLFFRSNATSGYDAIGEAQAMLNERQNPMVSPRYVMLNDRDNLKYAKDLAGRQTLQGRPENTWVTGQIGENIAGFDKVMTGSFLPTLAGGVLTTTTTAAHSDAPQSATVSAGVATNVDYRISSSIAVTATAGFAVGDKVTFTSANAVGLMDKNDTGQLMTFTIVNVVDATHVQVYPKPIAYTDAALSTLEKAYANIYNQIGNGDTMTRLNQTASAKQNAFWIKDSIEVLGGQIPGEYMAEFGGMKHLTTTMANGQPVHMWYDGDMTAATLRWRILTWYGITNKNPSQNGTFTTY